MEQGDRRTRSRDLILEAAREVFFREDFVGTNLDEVACKAGLSKGSIYRYFDNKAGLYVRVVGEKGREFSEAVNVRADASRDRHTRERLLDLWGFYLDYWLENPDHLRIFWALENEQVIGKLPGELVERIEEVWKRNLRVTQDLIDEGIRRGELVDCDSWALTHSLWVLCTSLIEQDATRIHRRVRGRTLHDAYFGAIELLLGSVLVPSQD